MPYPTAGSRRIATRVATPHRETRSFPYIGAVVSHGPLYFLNISSTHFSNSLRRDRQAPKRKTTP